MEAKEKAKELVGYFDNYPLTDYWKQSFALYVVDEVLKELIELDKYEHVPKSLIENWEEVKTEINNLTI